jgi:DnaK suppressor protein
MKAHPTAPKWTVNDLGIQRFRGILEAHRDDALAALNRLGDETRTANPDYPQDVADQSTSNLSKESLFQRGSECRRLLGMIETALARIQNGTFGLCADCGDEINPRRLDALPWTPYCLRCQEALEQQDGRAHSPSEGECSHLRKAG